MKNKIFAVSLIVATLLLGVFAFAQESNPSTDLNTVPVFTPPEKELVKDVKKDLPMPSSKSWVRVIGKARVYSPGQSKKAALEQTVEAFMPNQVTTKTLPANREFLKKPLDAAARKRALFQSISMKTKSVAPVKGYQKSFRGTPYKPTVFK